MREFRVDGSGADSAGPARKEGGQLPFQLMCRMMTDDLMILDTGILVLVCIDLRSTRIPHTHTRYLDSRRLHPKSTVHDEYVADNNGWMIMIMFG